MRILLVGDYPRDARLGSTKVLVKLQEEFRAAGHVCDLLLDDDLGDRPHHRALRWAWAPAAAFAAVVRATRTHGPYDVVDVASAEGLWLAVARRFGAFAETVIVARSNGVEHLNYQRMLEDADAGLTAKPWSRRLYYPAVRLSQVAAAARVADRLILLNDADRSFVLARAWKRASEIDVVPHGVSVRFLESASAVSSRGRGILFCGTWDHIKGIAYLVDAFSRLVERRVTIQPSGAPVALTVLGGGVPAREVLESFPPSVRPFVAVIDRAGEDAVIDAYRTHDVLAFPSTYEGFGMVLMEAMSQRLPVVTTPVGCASSLVEHDRNGLMVPPRDAAALADALAALLADPSRRSELADAAYRRVRGMTLVETARATLDVYQRAMAARSVLAHA